MQRFRAGKRLLAAGLAFGVIATGGILTATPAIAAELPAAERYAPSRLPDRITLTPAEDPTTQQVVTWRTATEVTSGIVEYRVMTAESYPGGVQSLVAQQRTEQTTDLGYTQAIHSATITGLQPGVSYMYRVGDGTNFSEWQDFETASGEADPYSFIFLGDVQTGIHSDASRVVRNAFRDRPNADLVLQIGDLVDDAEADAQWGELYDAFSYTLGTQNMLTTPGNHEYEGGLSTQWSSQFAYPQNGPQGEGEVYDKLEGTVYYTDHEGTRFISLNSNIVDTEGLQVQADWLEGVLADNPQQWTVVYFHHPIYSLDEGRNNLGIRQSWGPILEAHNVDLVLSGHDHAYGRGNLNANEQNLPEGADPQLSHTGPVYVSASVGSKFYNVGPRLWNENDAHLRRLVSGMQTYQVVDIAGGTLRFEARTADGAFLDGFTIAKQGDQKLVTDGVEPQVIDPGTPTPCLGCEPNPDPEPGDPTDPGEETPDAAFSYEHTKHLMSVNRSNAALPAGVAYHEARDVLYLGDQNGKNIFEIDPDTDEILRTITLPENIRDLGIDEAGELLYVGQQNRNWTVVSIAEGNFGEVVRGSYPIIESNRSIDVDPVNDFVYVAVPARGVEVFRASTGESLGVINGTADAYYVAADPVTGMIVTTKFVGVEGAIGIQAFSSRDGFARTWERSVRPNARQVDIDSTNGLLYIGYTGTAADRGGFSVHRLDTGALLVDMVGPEYGKDGYGIVVDEENQRVFVANRDFRLNPPGEELTAASVTVSTRVLGNEEPGDGEPGDGEPGDGEPGDGEPGDGEPGDGEPGLADYTATPLTAIPTEAVDTEAPEIRPVGSTVDPLTGHIFLADEMRPARVHEIDPETDEIVRTITAPTTDPVSDGLRDVAYDPATGHLFVAFSSNWVVMDAETGERVRGPFAFSGGVRGMDVDFERGLVYGGTRGSGFDVADAVTGELLQSVAGPEDGGAWRTHGVAYDPVDDLLYVSTSDAGGSTQGVRVYDASTYTLVGALAVPDADFRSIAVDGEAGIFVVGHQDIEFDNSGASVYRTADLGLVQRLAAHEYGNKVYGVSIDAERDALYISARERHPAGIIRVQLPAEPQTAPEDPGAGDPGDGEPGDRVPYSAIAVTAVPSAEVGLDPDIRPVGTAVDPATGIVFMANEMRPARVHVIDPATNEMVRTMTAPTTDPVSDGLRDIAYDAEHGHLYVAFGSNWVVMDAETGELVRGPFAFSGGVRGMDVDFERGLVFGGLRGSGFDVMDAETGDLVQTVAGPEDGGAWRTHGVAYDPVDDLLYISNSDAAESTEGVRVYDAASYELVKRLSVAAADYRSITVDGEAGLVIVGHQTSEFNNSGVSVLRTSDLSLVERLSAYEYGDKVYGVSVDTERDLLYVSARDRYPVGLIQVQLPPTP